MLVPTTIPDVVPDPVITDLWGRLAQILYELVVYALTFL